MNDYGKKRRRKPITETVEDVRKDARGVLEGSAPHRAAEFAAGVVGKLGLGGKKKRMMGPSRR